MLKMAKMFNLTYINKGNISKIQDKALHICHETI